MLAPWKESYDQPRQCIKKADKKKKKKQSHQFVNKGPYSQTMVFPVVMYGCESWSIKVECWRIDAFKRWCWRRLECPLDCKEIKPINSKGNQLWIFTGRTDTIGDAPILWPLDEKSWLTGKDLDAGKDWRQRRRGWQRKRWLDIITDE